MTYSVTQYTTGCLRLVKSSGLISYFSAAQFGGAGPVFSSPEAWVGTLDSSALVADHAEMKLRCVERSFEHFAKRAHNNTFGSHERLFSCLVDEEFFLSYDTEMPEHWLAQTKSER